MCSRRNSLLYVKNALVNKLKLCLITCHQSVFWKIFTTKLTFLLLKISIFIKLWTENWHISLTLLSFKRLNQLLRNVAMKKLRSNILVLLSDIACNLQFWFLQAYHFKQKKIFLIISFFFIKFKGWSGVQHFSLMYVHDDVLL